MEISYLTASAGFSDSDNSSGVYFAGGDAVATAAGVEFGAPAPPGEVEALRRLSDNLGAAFQSLDLDFCVDALIALHPSAAGGGSSPPREVRVHRCVLSARSPFFRDVFSKLAKGPAEAGPSRVELKELLRDMEVGYEALALVLGYLYSGKVAPLPRATCTCVDEECRHEACRPAVDFMVEVLYASYTFQIFELVNLFQRHLLDILDKVEIDDIPAILSVANLCGKCCERLLSKCIYIVAQSDLDMVTLGKTLPQFVEQITDSRISAGLAGPETIGLPGKHIRRIYQALDSDDVELVRMLLEERQTTLDDAYALHYAVAHCDLKITTELLDLGLADINHKNPRGYTVLHIAAMRKEPKIIVSLLTKGARPFELTSDGRKALQISKRLTKSVDYHKSTEEGKDTPKDRLCIEILEQAERRDPQLGEASVSLAIAGDNLRERLLYLENRVALARVLFPMEAKLAMAIAQVDGTLEFTLGSPANSASEKQRNAMDLNETPFKIKEEHQARMRALSKTVELGKRFFPRCSEVLDKIMDDDMVTCLERDSSEEKRRRYMELQDVFTKAFSEDKELHRSGLSSSSSTSTGVARSRK